MSLREAFLAKATEFKTVPFEVEGTVIYIRPMSKGLKSRIESLISGEKTAKVCTDIRWHALSACMVDETGAAILTPDDRKVFDSWEDRMIEPVFEKILDIGRVSESDKEAFSKN